MTFVGTTCAGCHRGAVLEPEGRAFDDAGREWTDTVDGWTCPACRAERNVRAIEGARHGDGWAVVTADAIDALPCLPAGSVDLIVTSPPYADQRSYDPDELGGRRGNTVANRRLRARSRRQRSQAPAEWADWMADYTRELLRVVSPAGSLLLNLGVILRDGEENPAVEDVVRQAREQGWRRLQTIVWTKPNGQVPSAPGYLTVSHEYVFWLSPTTRPWRAYEQPAGSRESREIRTPHSRQSVQRMAALYTGAGSHRKQGRTHRLHPDGARPTTVIEASVGGTPNPDGHSARMPVALADHLVRLASPVGGLVLDPFSGNGTTGVAALRNARRYVGVELLEDYAAGQARRVSTWWRDQEPAPDVPAGQETLPL